MNRARSCGWLVALTVAGQVSIAAGETAIRPPGFAAVPQDPAARRASHPERLSHDVRPHPDDASWSDAFSLPIIDGPVFALAIYRGELIAAGAFEMAGGRRVNHIARWDGDAWRPLGEGLENDVFALAVYQDRLIAGGDYTSSGDVNLGPVASWDGAAWSPLGTPASGGVVGIMVRSLLVSGSTLITGGNFNRMGDVPAGYIARWDGAHWSAIGEGFDDAVLALGTYEGDLVAGGRFTHSGNAGVTRIARWNGATWVPFGAGISGDLDPEVRSVAVLHGTLYAGGRYSNGRGAILQWTGAEWDSVLDAPPGEVSDLRVEGDSLFAAGFLVRPNGIVEGLRRWDGSGWSGFGSGIPTQGMASIRYGGRLVVGGYLYGLDEPAVLSGVATWDGEGWKPFERVDPSMHGLEGYPATLLADGDRLIVGGLFRFPSGGAWSRPQSVAAWDGTRWIEMGDNPSGIVYAMTVHRGEVVIGGSIAAYQSPVDIMGLARWDGASWIGFSPALRGYVYKLATYRDQLYVVGYLSLDGGPEVYQVARCDGNAWHSIGSPSSGGEIHALEVHGDRLFAAGLFESLDGVPVRNIAAWDGSGWRPVGNGVDGGVVALASYQGSLMAGGLIYSVDGHYTSGLARWDGASWSAVPEIIASPVTAMGVAGGRLFVSAWTVILPTAPGHHARESLHRIAQFDGATWSGLGSGLNQPAFDLVDYRGRLHAAGYLTEAGGKASFHVASWDITRSADPSAAIEWLPSAPNPFNQGTTLSFTLAAPGSVRLTIHDLSGREVARLVDGALPGGPRSVVWNGTDTRGRSLASGVYLARLVLAGGEARSTRIVRVE